MPENILQSFSDFIFPRECEICQRPVDRAGRFVCARCFDNLPFIPPFGCCRVCGRTANGIEKDFLCEDCSDRRRAPHFDAAASALHYYGRTRQMILDFKFNHAMYLAPDITDWLEMAYRGRFNSLPVDLVIPIPLTLMRRWQRGYNQCAIPARMLAERIHTNFCDNNLVRVGSPARQGGLDEAGRRKNVLNTFKIRKPATIRNRTVLLVDDIMATGSTLSEAARILHEAGSPRVWCITIARSERG